jgi:uracil-DNA glycosylase family 4
VTELDALRALTADLREWLIDAARSGATAIPTDLALPAAAPSDLPAATPSGPPPPPVAVGTMPKVTPVLSTPASPTIAAASPAAASRWATLAASARDEAAVAAATGAEGLRRIREDLGDCRRCGLCTSRRSIVYGVGDPDADLMIVGEGPGHDEDLSGEPFVGPAGQMLDKMLENVLKLRRDQVYIANVVKCRPPANRNPAPDEVAACAPFLERQIRAVRPQAMLVLGNVAMKALFQVETGIMRQRGQWLEWSGTPTMPTFHPAYLLRNPDDKRKTFDDLKALKALYDERGGKR